MNSIKEPVLIRMSMDFSIKIAFGGSSLKTRNSGGDCLTRRKRISACMACA
jgi:hypothetical protein